MFTLFPAIDLRHGRVVRLEEGRDDRSTIYGDDPVAVAQGYVDAGAEAIHLVDLDAAFRDGDNRALIRDVVQAVGVPVQVGGGVRSDEGVDALLELGVRRVIIGSAAVSNPDWVGEVADRHGDKVVVGLDAKHGEVRTHGWVEGSGVSLLDLGRVMAGKGVRRVIYTDISRDGMLQGPDIEGSAQLARETGLEVVVSGGVSGADDVRRAAAEAGSGIVGIIVGKALFEGRTTVEEAIEAARQGAKV